MPLGILSVMFQNCCTFICLFVCVNRTQTDDATPENLCQLCTCNSTRLVEDGSRNALFLFNNSWHFYVLILTFVMRNFMRNLCFRQFLVYGQDLFTKGFRKDSLNACKSTKTDCVNISLQ